MKLHLVCDISGSMCEAGKPFIMRTLVIAIAQWVRLGYGSIEIKLYTWSSEAICISNWNIKDEFPLELLVCKGYSNSEALVKLFGDKPDGKIILLTDGFLSKNAVKALKKWQTNLPLNTLRVIAIGADANPQLKAQLHGTYVFPAEDIFAALDGLLEGDAV